MDPTLATILAAAIGGIATVVAAWLTHRQKAAAKQQDSAPMSTPPGPGGQAAISAASSASSVVPPVAATVHPPATESTAPRPAPPEDVEIPPYFRRRSGTLLYSDGSEQSFIGFRCLYSDRLYYSRSLESLAKDTYTSAPSIDLDHLARIDLSERPNPNVRRGTARLRSGKILENVFFYVGECSWWDDPGLEGKLNDPAIVALVFTQS